MHSKKIVSKLDDNIMIIKVKVTIDKKESVH